MDGESRFIISLKHLQDYEFKVSFDWEQAPDLFLDEPEPLGREKGPNAARVLAAAVGNCLSASLLFCLRKSRLDPPDMEATVTGSLVHNARGRLRIGGLDVVIRMKGPIGHPARIKRCLDLFEDYCLITESVRSGIPVGVRVLDDAGRQLAGACQ